MIIDKKYDMALWLMFSKDIENRDLIIKFLESIPQELIDKLQISLKEGKTNLSEEEEIFSFPVNENKAYWYSIDNRTEILEIGRMFSILGEKTEYFHLILYPTSKNQLDSMRYRETRPIGLVYNYFVDEKNKNIRRTFDFQLFSFDMCKSLLGGLYMKTSNHLDQRNDKYLSSLVDRNIDGLSVKDLEDRKVLKKIVRKRKNTK